MKVILFAIFLHKSRFVEFLINYIFRSKWWSILIFDILVQICGKTFGWVGQKGAWSFRSWNCRICCNSRMNWWAELFLCMVMQFRKVTLIILGWFWTKMGIAFFKSCDEKLKIIFIFFCVGMVKNGDDLLTCWTLKSATMYWETTDKLVVFIMVIQIHES